ncbi:MAG: AraC family transcriptional regulator [Mongoliibacter sp.]|uniref:helix-turn-helix domain-containing protein n=1 Tax=Mongoliibacter sp. TaxID=2022438 RepID=UPI0012F19CA1|nr:helix-turn-helix transcriptional regulator [Mongoliibacter sp.]TVP45253.1 MAG: AraC family transcriptional regulator [Mongoliibacter sp.]
MDFKFFPPHRKLSQHIVGYVYWNDFVKYRKEILFTVKGTGSLGIPLNSDFKCAVKGRKLKNNCLSKLEPIIPVLYGQMTSYGKVMVEGHVQLIFVVFTPLGLYSFLKGDASLVTDSIIPLDSLNEIFRNFEFNQGDPIEDNLICLEQVLFHGFEAKGNQDYEFPLSSTIEYLLKHQGKSTVQELADLAGVSTRTLELKFKKYVGLTPKTYSRVIRFNALIKQFSESSLKDSCDWVEKYGYTDQSHLIKDFKDFTGMSPGKYFKNPSIDDSMLNKSISK